MPPQFWGDKYISITLNSLLNWCKLLRGQTLNTFYTSGCYYCWSFNVRNLLECKYILGELWTGVDHWEFSESDWVYIFQSITVILRIFSSCDGYFFFWNTNYDWSFLVWMIWGYRKMAQDKHRPKKNTFTKTERSFVSLSAWTHRVHDQFSTCIHNVI